MSDHEPLHGDETIAMLCNHLPKPKPVEFSKSYHVTTGTVHAVDNHLSHHDVVNEKGSVVVGSNPAGNVHHGNEKSGKRNAV